MNRLGVAAALEVLWLYLLLKRLKPYQCVRHVWSNNQPMSYRLSRPALVPHRAGRRCRWYFRPYGSGFERRGDEKLPIIAVRTWRLNAPVSMRCSTHWLSWSNLLAWSWLFLSGVIQRQSMSIAWWWNNWIFVAPLAMSTQRCNIMVLFYWESTMAHDPNNKCDEINDKRT